MKLANTALVTLASLALVGIMGTGCALKNAAAGASDGDLGTSESELVADDQESDDTDQSIETGVDDPLSGAAPADPGTPADGASDADLLAKVKENAGRFFQPAGCITTTIAGHVATHVFKDCTGPDGLKTFNGTIVSTWVRGNASLTVTHESTNFQINGASISGKRVVVYTKSGSLVTKTRTGDWSGTTASGKPITHMANFVTTYDAATKCITRDGSASTSVGRRQHERSIAGYKRCGIGRLGCPQSGEIVLTRTRAAGSASVAIDFLGGADARVTLPSGRTFSRKLVCNAHAG
jgi:hypothetical protein